MGWLGDQVKRNVFFSQIIGFYLPATQSEMVDLHLLEFDVNYAWTKSFEPAPSETRRLSEEVEKSQTLVWSYPLILILRRYLSNKKEIFIGYF